MNRELLKSHTVGSASAQDRLDIQDTICAAVFYMDCCQFEEAEALFAPGATFDYSSVYGADFSCVPLKQFMTGARQMGETFTVAQHLITNFMIDVKADAAQVRSQVQGTHEVGGKRMKIGAIYRHKMVRAASRWLIAEMSADVLFQHGDVLPDSGATS